MAIRGAVMVTCFSLIAPPPQHVANLTADGSAYWCWAARRRLMLRLLYNCKACKTKKVLWPAGIATCEGICINGRAFFVAKDWTIQLQSTGDVHRATTTGQKLHSILRQFCLHFILFIYSSWFYVSNFRSKRSVNSVQHIEWNPCCVHIVTRVPQRTHILSVWPVCLTNYASYKFCTNLYSYITFLRHNTYNTQSLYHKTFVPPNVRCPEFSTKCCEAFFQLPNYTWG